MILLAVLLGFTFLYLAVSIAAHAETPFAEKRAQCFLQVEGVVHIDGICDLTSTTLPGEPPKGFQIGTGTNERFLASPGMIGIMDGSLTSTPMATEQRARAGMANMAEAMP